MGWCAYISIDDVTWASKEWSYGHVIARWINDALERAGEPLGEEEGMKCRCRNPDDPSGPLIPCNCPETWWKRLNGMTGVDGHRYLGVIVEQLEKDPDHYRKMDDERGPEYGNYDEVLKMLTEMRDACKSKIPMTWEASG